LSCLGTAGSNFIRTTVGAMVDSFELKAAVGEIVSCDVGYIAQDSTMSSGAVTSLAPTTTKPYVFNNIKLEIPDGILVGNAKEVTFSVNNNIDRDNVLNGSRVANGLLPMNREYGRFKCKNIL